MLNVIRQWVIKTMMKNNTGVVQTLPKRDLIELNTQITAQRLMQNGVDPQALKNVNQVENAVNAIDNRPPVQQGIRSTKSAKVFDLEGKEIKDPKNIMGGKEINQQTLNEELMKTDNPYSDLVNTPRPKTLAEREAEVLARMEKENKEAAQRIRDRKADEKQFNKDVEEAGGMEEFLKKNPIDDDTGDFAQGGRAGFRTGLGKRFLELFKPKPKPKFDVERFRKGPIDLDFLKNIDKKDIEKFIRTRDTMGPGGYGMYDNFADMPAGLKAAELIKTIKGPNNKINYKAAELFLGKKLKGNESANELIQMLNRREMRADGGRAGFANGTGAPSITYDFDKKQESMGPNFETNDPKEALKEIVRRMINVEPAKVPLSEDMSLMFDLNRAQIGGSKDIGGGELNFGINKGFGRDDTGIGFQFRKQFKDGSGMTRRTFLKLLGGMAAIPIVGKFLKPLKTAKGVKKIPMIATDNVPGKPEWFDALVNKVILEGDDVTKRFATSERQSIHQKTLNDGSVVRVTEDVDDGAVRVEYENEANVFGDDVLMQYKKPLPDEGDPRPAAEFTTAESGPVGRQTGPDDFELDVDEVGGSSINDLDSDVSKLKEYATGKKPTMKEFVQNKKRRDKASAITNDIDGAASDAVIRRQGDYVPEYDDYASGGIAKMLGE